MVAQRSGRRSGLILRSIRAVTGLVLFAFVTCHLLNASLGMISVAAMDAARPFLSGVWGALPLNLLLMLSALLHFFVGLYSIYQKPSLRTSTQDTFQVLTSIAIVPLVATHAIPIFAFEQGGTQYSYSAAIKYMWQTSPAQGLIQVTLIAIVWIHGCTGLLNWLRAKPGAQRFLNTLYPCLVAIPIAALLGFSEAGRTVLAEAQESSASGYSSQGSYGGGGYATQSDGSGYGEESSQSSEYGTGGYSDNGYGSDEASGAAQSSKPTGVYDVVRWVIISALSLTGLTFLARLLRQWISPNRIVHVSRNGRDFPDRVAGVNLLDVFRQNHQPHASICEGRGRCGTCAVRVLSSEYPLPEPEELELRTLHRLSLPEGTRLACQVVPQAGSVEVEAVYPPDFSFEDEETTPAILPATPEAQT